MKKFFVFFTLLFISVFTIAAVDDYGIQVLQKAAEYMSGTSKTDYYFKTKLVGKDNSELDLEVNDDNQLKVVLDGKVDTNNTSTATLTAGSTFTGTATNILDYSVIFITVYSDVASATDGLTVEMSSDGTTWYSGGGDLFTVGAATQKTFSIQPHTKFYRVKYTNGGTNQATFDLQTILKKGNSLASSHRIQDAISDDDDAELVKSVVTAKNDSGSFVNLGATDSNNLRVANVEDGLAIAKGEVTGTTFIHKFGVAEDFDDGDGTVSVYDGADDAHINQMVYQYSSTADIDTCTSDNAGDTQVYEVQGLDTNWNLTTQNITMTGQTKATLSTSLIRLFRIKNTGSTNNAGHIYCYVDSAITNGIPDDPTKVRGVIQPGNNQTLMAIYTCPASKTCYMRSFYGAIAGANKTSNYVIELRARQDGGVFQLKHLAALSETGSSYVDYSYVEPEVFAAKTDIEMRVSLTESPIVGAKFAAGFDIVVVDN
jgi:hypothetical protein